MGATLAVMSSRLVYSSDDGRISLPKDKTATTAGSPGKARSTGKKKPDGPSVPSAPEDGWVRLWRTKGGRGGKTATVITGLGQTGSGLEHLAVELRRFAGAGGSVREGAIEIQGDHRERLQKHLSGLGYRVKLAGG